MAKDLELVKQVDGAKKDAKDLQTQLERVQRDNDSLKKDLDKATKKIISQIQQPKSQPKQIMEEPKV